MLSLNSVTCQTHKGEIYNQLWNCEVIWHMASTQLSVILLVVDETVNTTHQNASFLGHVSQFKASVLSNNSNCRTHSVNCSGQAWESRSLFVMNICPAIVKSTAPHLHNTHTVHTPLKTVYEFSPV
jgi:hypothetical protein